MSPTGQPADPAAVETERRQWDDGSSTRDRVYETAIQLYEPATAAEVAQLSDCSEGAARDHLRWFADRGIIEEIEGRPKRYERNQAYFDWRRADELRHRHSDEEFQEILRELDEQERALRDKYEVAHPNEIDAIEAADFGDIHEVWEDIGDWRTIRRRVRLIERARKDRESLADVPG